MKKSALLLGILATASLCLTACNDSKDYTMTFEEAVDTVNHSALQDILSENNNFEQTFIAAGNLDSDGTKIDANISASSKQSLDNKNSESSTTFGANITSEGETIKVDGALDIKLVDDSIYLNLSSLDLTGSENLAMVTMITEGFKNQWFVIPMTGLSDMPDTFSVLKDSKELNDKAKEIIINEGSTVYNGKFTQFNGYNAWKFSLDTEKLQELVNNYYGKINETLDEGVEQEIPQLNIQNFEGYLVITGKDKVTSVIENMDMVEGDMILNVNGFGGEDYEITMSSNGEAILVFTANKKNSNYEISFNMNNSAKLEGTITPKLSSSKIDVKFDVTLTVKSNYKENNDTTVPLKGSRTYSPIAEFNVIAPENAQDLTEMLQGYLGGTFGGDEYYEDYDYEDYDYEDSFEPEEDYVEELSEEIE